jgi:hypothetical protein
MKILIKFPTKNRIDKFFKTLDLYYSMCDDINNITFMITLDNDDKLMNNNIVLNKLKNYKNLLYFFGDSLSKISAVNRDIENFNEWDILLLASDDMIPIYKGYDSIIIEKMKEFYPDTDGVLWFNDGFQGKKLNTLSILGKKYYKRFGYIYNPEYLSIWSDNEFMDVANILGKQTYFDLTIIKHEHPDWGYGNRDKVHELNSFHNSIDEQIYYKRKQNNFGL